MKSIVYRISTSSKKGDRKQNIDQVKIIAGQGINGDAHSSSDRPLSLLPFESFIKVSHPDLDLHPGDFAENITTTGLDYTNLKIGSRMRLGESIEIEIIQIGKKCHNNCIIKEKVGDCIMPREGVFAKVHRGGLLKEGDIISLLDNK